jgi:general secretion pathway protein D
MSRAQAAQTPTRSGSRPLGGAWLSGIFMGLAMVGSVASHGADKSVSTIAENEVRRREALVNEAGARLVEADALLKAGKTEEAVNAYSQIYQSLPKAAMAAALRDHARAGFAAASCNRARELIAGARYAEAMQLLDNVLSPDVDPDHEMARKLKQQFQDPDRYPTALTPEHISKVKDVEKLLELANSALEIADFDKSRKVYEEVIRLDPYNKSARRGMERAEQKRSEYFDSARDHTRAKLLGAVDQEWEQQVPPSADMSALFAAENAPLTNARSGRDAILAKLRSMIVPKVDFSGATLEEVIEYIRVRSRDLDPKGRGVDFVMNVPPESSGKLVSLYLEQVPLEDVLRYVTEKAGASYRVEDRAVTIISLTENSTQLIPKTYRVPPNFIQTSVVGEQPAGGGAAPADPFAAARPGAGAGPGLVVHRMGAREFLESRGVIFKEGASATYIPTTNSLFVRNTPDNLAIVDMLVEQASASSPKQVIVSVKLMEVGQTNFDEIRTDLGLGTANIPGSDRVFGTGGAAGVTTSGLRPSGNILGQPSIDSLLTNGQNVPTLDSASPAAFQLLGAFTDPQFQVRVTAISQKKGTDLISVPSVIMKSGVKTEIEMVREFPYPTEFDPPEIPQDFDPNGTIAISALSGTTQQRSGTAPITPTTPTAFEVRKVGSLLEVEAVVSEDGRQVELTLAPSTTEFEGFIDYGTDITNSSFFSTFDPILFAFRNSSVEYVVDNPILQPVFRTNKLSTGVLVWDGATVVLGGVLSEKRTQINDKVPILGDIPFLGKLWQNKVTQVEKKNVLFFVTVKVIDAAGQPIRPVATAQAR